MNYYIGEAGQQRGPFNLDQLRAMHLSADALVWREGMPQWQPVRTVPELQLLAAPPAPYAAAQPYSATDSKRILAGLLGIFLGPLGIHKFVLGFVGAGLVYLLVTILTCGVALPVMHLLGLIEGIIYLSKSDEEFCRLYVVERRSWF